MRMGYIFSYILHLSNWLKRVEPYISNEPYLSNEKDLGRRGKKGSCSKKAAYYLVFSITAIVLQISYLPQKSL